MKETCAKIDSELDSIYTGIVSCEIGGVKQLFAFLNYDLLEKKVKTPENELIELLFCRNDDTNIYPICDSNANTTLKWATVDELLVERKIVNEEVDSTIHDAFVNNSKLWNVKDSNDNYVQFPFVVYAVETTPENTFKTAQIIYDSSEDDFVLNGKIENYGTSEENGIADEYDARYCFTITPLPFTEKQPSTTEQNIGHPKRYVMFAWNVRYIIKENEPDNPDEKTTSGSEEDADKIAIEKLQFPTIYTRTKNAFTHDETIVMWGVLNEHQFTHL